jgi:hypothetical protein
MSCHSEEKSQTFDLSSKVFIKLPKPGMTNETNFTELSASASAGFIRIVNSSPSYLQVSSKDQKLAALKRGLATFAIEGMDYYLYDKTICCYGQKELKLFYWDLSDHPIITTLASAANQYLSGKISKDECLKIIDAALSNYDRSGHGTGDG